MVQNLSIKEAIKALNKTKHKITMDLPYTTLDVYIQKNDLLQQLRKLKHLDKKDMYINLYYFMDNTVNLSIHEGF
jgi:D-mannonate dehydratase